MNTRTLIVVKKIHVSDEGQRSLMKFKGIPSEEVSSAEYLYSGLFQIEPSAGMLHSGQADDSVALNELLTRMNSMTCNCLTDSIVRLLIIFTLLWAITTNNQSKLFVIINDAAAMKHMASSFAKLEKFEGVNFRRCHLRIEESLRAQDNDKIKGNNVAGPSVVNMVEHNNSSRYNDHKGKRKHHDTRANPNKKSKVTCWKYGKPGHLKKDCKAGNVGNIDNGSSTKGSEDGSFNPLKGQSMFNKSLQIYYVTYVSKAFFVQDDDVAWWADSGAIVHVCKDRCWFTIYESLNDGSILHIGNESTSLVHGRGCVDLRHGVFIGSGYLSNHIFRLNIVSDNIGSAFMSTFKLNDSILWHARLCHVQFKRMQDMSKDGLIPASDMDTERAAVRRPDPKLKTLGKRGIECIFVGYVENSKAFRFYVIEPNDSVAINSIIKSRDVIFDENRFSSVPRPSQRSLVKRIEDSGGSVVSERVTDEIVQQSKPELKKSKSQRTPKDFGPEFQLYLIEGTRDLIFNQHSYCFNVKDDPKTFNKVDGTIKKFKARLVIQGFNQKSGIDYFDTYAPAARISTIRLLIAMASIHNIIIHQMDVKTAFLNRDLEEEVYMNQPLGFIMPANENKVCKLIKSMYGLKQAPKQWHQKFDEVVLSNGYLLNQADKCVYSKFDASSKGVIIFLYVDDMLIFGTDHAQSHYIEKVLKKFNYSNCTLVSTPLDTSRLAIQRVLNYLKKTMDYRLVYSSYPSVLEGYTDASWISNTEDNSSISGRVFLLGDAAGKEVEWLKNLLLEISLWVKPITPISICYDGAATLAKAYSQLYNGKSRHLGDRHTMIRELIMNEVVSIEFVMSQQNLVDHLTKGLSRDLVIKSAEGNEIKVQLSIWGWRYGMYTQRSMNTQTLIVVKGIHVSDEEVAGNIHQRVNGFSFVAHRVRKLKDTIRGYSIRGSIFSGISLHRSVSD
nr:zinc finger, CCHC-type [Tanacetum cinerariifolium]